MKNALFVLISLSFVLVSCDKQTLVENRLERTEWQLTQSIRTVTTSELELTLPSAQSGNYAVDRTKILRGKTVLFQDDGSGTLTMEGMTEAFEWESRTVGENIQVTILTDTEKRFQVLIGDRDLQLWESRTQERYGSSIRMITEKWELKP